MEPGNLANIVIFDEDYLASSKEELDQLTSVLTLVSGKAVFEDSDLRNNTMHFNTDNTPLCQDSCRVHVLRKMETGGGK